MNKFKVILLATVAAMAYGILHDQITARICLEYFTVAHPPLFPTASPSGGLAVLRATVPAAVVALIVWWRFSRCTEPPIRAF